MKNDFPMQPVVMDLRGTVRFKKNSIVRFLLDAGPFNMNQLANLPGVTREEFSQFAQLIGYSVDGYSDLSYSDPDMVKQANHDAEALVKKGES